MSKHIKVFGSVNLDLVLQTEKFPLPGETVLAKSHNWFPGGKGANQALAAKKLGGEVELIAKVGVEDTTHQALKLLKDNQVNLEHLTYNGDHPTGIAVIKLNSHKENNIVVSPGANMEWHESDEELRSLIYDADIVVLQLEIPIDVTKRILKISKELGKYTVLNPAPAKAEIRSSLKDVDLLIVNETEAAILAEKTLDDFQMINDVYRALEELGPSKVVITLGSRGAYVFDEGEKEYYKAHKVNAVDTTAAGDTFVGGLVAQISNGKTLFEAAKVATAASAIAVSRMGAQTSIPSIDEVNKFIG